MKEVIKKWGFNENCKFKISFEDSQEIKDKIFNLLIDWYMKHDCYSGESIQQMDGSIIDAPNFLSDLADVY